MAMDRCQWCGAVECVCIAWGEDGAAETRKNWRCAAGHLHEDGLHCPSTRQEPPWGCPCSFCQGGDGDSEEALTMGRPP